MSIAPVNRRRAIGIVRVSQVNGRSGSTFVSPGEQADRIRQTCQRDGLELLKIVEELDVSGGTPLPERSGLQDAILAIESGDAEVIVAAYFDRLGRSLQVLGELVSRVEAAGGQVLAVDTGLVTNGSAGQWLSGTMLGAVAEFTRRTAKERSSEAQRRAVERGVAPFPRIPPGYLRGEDGCLIPDPQTAPTVETAFKLRADGAPLREVRQYLSDNGIARSYHGVSAMLGSRVVLGQIHFGELVNETAHPPIVDLDTWQRVQRISVPRGRRAKSDRLLARLGILLCESCGSRMVVGNQTQGGRSYPFYRCGRVKQDCSRRVTISAVAAEEIISQAVRDI